jgi:Tol biopolymer transport system component
VTITAFDPVTGNRKALLTIPNYPGASYHWTPSPDGSLVAIGNSALSGDQIIRFIPVHGGQTRTVILHGYPWLTSLDWAPDSTSVFVGVWEPSGTTTLLHVDLKGQVQPIWQNTQNRETWMIPSPDGRHLAMLGRSEEANVWMIDNF